MSRVLPVVQHNALKRACAKAINTFEHDPDFQVRFHLTAMVFWMVNFVVGVVMLFCFPREWTAIGVFYVFSLSIYANWDTDYDAVSAGLAYKHARRADEEEQAEELHMNAELNVIRSSVSSAPNPEAGTDPAP